MAVLERRLLQILHYTTCYEFLGRSRRGSASSCRVQLCVKVFVWVCIYYWANPNALNYFAK